MRTNNKRGISLIVLVITIIVMIILAAAIILSISNSGVIDKANKAKKSSDVASIKEYVNVLESEYELKVDGTSAYSTKESYVNDKLYDNGYKDVALSVDGELYMGLKANARKAIVDGLAIGDKISGYNPSVASTTTSGKENTAPNAKSNGEVVENQVDTPQTVYRTEFSTWRFFGISENGEIKIAPDMISDSKTMKLSGKGGYNYGPEELDKVCNTLYSIENVGVARCISMNDVYDILGIDEENREYYAYIDSSVEGGTVYNNVPTTIGQILEKKGMSSLQNTETPDGKDINTYIPVLKLINQYDKSIKHQERKSLVFMNPWYYTSDRMIYGGIDAEEDMDLFYFCINIVHTDSFKAAVPFSSDGTSSCSTTGFPSLSIRPLVCLDASVSLNKVDGNWSI